MPTQANYYFKSVDNFLYKYEWGVANAMVQKQQIKHKNEVAIYSECSQ